MLEPAFIQPQLLLLSAEQSCRGTTTHISHCTTSFRSLGDVRAHKSRLHCEAAAARHRSDVDTDLADQKTTRLTLKDASTTTGPAAPRECAAAPAARAAADREYNRPRQKTTERRGRFKTKEKTCQDRIGTGSRQRHRLAVGPTEGAAIPARLVPTYP